MRSVTYSMSMSLDGYSSGRTGASTGGCPTRTSSASGSTRSAGSASTCLDDGCTRRCCTGRPPSRIGRSTRQSSSGLRSGSRSRKSCSLPRCRRCRATRAWPPAALRRRSRRLRAEPGEGDVAIGGATIAAEAAASGLIDEYRADRLPRAGRRGHPVLPPAPAPGGSGTRRDPHLRLGGRLPQLPRRAVARSGRIGPAEALARIDRPPARNDAWTGKLRRVGRPVELPQRRSCPSRASPPWRGAPAPDRDRRAARSAGAARSATKPEPVLEPAARTRLASVRRQRIPQPVDLGLVLALENERDRLAEAELGPAVEALEPLATDGEVDRQDHPGRPAGRLCGGAPDLVDAAVGQQARVEAAASSALPSNQRQG